MRVGAAELVMTLALRCLPRDGSDWGRAMLAEFDLARREGKGFGFALGCLIAAWRRLPLHADGQVAVASHTVALGLIVPISTFHLGCAVSGAKFMLSGRDHYYAMLMAGGTRGRFLADAYIAATPVLTLLLLLLASVHLVIAWFMLHGRWRGAASLWLVATIIATLIAHVVSATIPNAGGSTIQFAALAIELATIPLLAGWRKVGPGSSIWKETR